MLSDSGLAIEHIRDGDAEVVRVEGEVDLATVERFETAILRRSPTHRPRSASISQGSRSFGSEGVRALVAAHQAAIGKNVKLVVSACLPHRSPRARDQPPRILAGSGREPGLADGGGTSSDVTSSLTDGRPRAVHVDRHVVHQSLHDREASTTAKRRAARRVVWPAAVVGDRGEQGALVQRHLRPRRRAVRSLRLPCSTAFATASPTARSTSSARPRRAQLTQPGP